MKTIITIVIVVMGMIANAMTSEETIASTLWMEARGEGEVGVRAVASVIANRAKKSGKTMEYECLKPMQFSCWNGRVRTVPKGAKGKMWNYCRQIAKLMVSGKFKVENNATHYYNPNLCKPSWGSKMTDVVMIGKHKFGRC